MDEKVNVKQRGGGRRLTLRHTHIQYVLANLAGDIRLQPPGEDLVDDAVTVVWIVGLLPIVVSWRHKEREHKHTDSTARPLTPPPHLPDPTTNGSQISAAGILRRCTAGARERLAFSPLLCRLLETHRCHSPVVCLRRAVCAVLQHWPQGNTFKAAPSRQETSVVTGNLLIVSPLQCLCSTSSAAMRNSWASCCS